MATSGVYAITVTALDLIKNSMLNVGSTAIEETPTGAEAKLGRDGLNYLIKQLEGPPNFIQSGQKMWQRETGALTLDATKNSYSLKASGGDCDIQIPLEILTAVLRHTASASDDPLKPLNLQQYQAIANKSETGTPQKYYYEKRLTEGKLYLDRKPTASVVSAYTISFIYRQPLEVISSNTNEFDIESSHYLMLELALSRWLAPKYGRAISNDIERQYAEAVAMVSTFQPENSDVFYERDGDN